ncbi:Insulinase (Peptidase M16) [Orbilia brochopaga]|uniref:Insulinase (Peptidase M16) n=1 Tax=Orbilia brochopaga TaxID=3140254 RepID=A0AAV9V7G2_9PEZI
MQSRRGWHGVDWNSSGGCIGHDTLTRHHHSPLPQLSTVLLTVLLVVLRVVDWWMRLVVAAARPRRGHWPPLPRLRPPSLLLPSSSLLSSLPSSSRLLSSGLSSGLSSSLSARWVSRAQRHRPPLATRPRSLRQIAHPKTPSQLSPPPPLIRVRVRIRTRLLPLILLSQLHLAAALSPLSPPPAYSSYSPQLPDLHHVRSFSSNSSISTPPSSSSSQPSSSLASPSPPSPSPSSLRPSATSMADLLHSGGVANKKSLEPHLITDKLEKPLLDNRTYRVIQLPNKVEVLLVHDDTTDKSSAALDVRVGSMCDDDELPGQAHAVEHVLFMGTKKYPGENDYMAFLANHAGSSNAYTSALSTNYYFEISHKSLHDALDRFSQFFIAPLFDPNGLDRELNAVDSEHKKNLQQDNYRSYQLGKFLSNPDHPYSKFTTGNLETLRDAPRARGVDVRDRFIKFHERYYSGNLMKLCILGRESLDEMESWVVELFSDIKNKDLPVPTFQGAPLTATELGTQYWMKPVMETRSVTYTFPYLDENPFYESQPSRYIGHLIGHEGPGSILSVLKEAGIATSLSAGHMRICNDTGMYVVNIRLTVNGLQKIPEITALLFSYIRILNTTPPQEWVVKELQSMAEVEFRYKQKSTNAANFVSEMASTMQNMMPREYLLSEHKIRKFDADLIKRGLSYLRPDNFRLAITTPELPDGLTWESKERWYGVEYTLQKIPAKVLEMATKAYNGDKPPAFDVPGGQQNSLHLPHPNPFIPTNFDVVRKEVEHAQKVPSLLRNTPESRIWFKKDDTFWAPKANTYFTLRTPRTYSTPRDYAIARFFCELVKDSLHEYYYDAELAGLEYSLSPNMLGFDLEISGYNDKMIVLLTKVLEAMRDLKPKEGRFEVIKERLVRAYRNWELGTPYQMVPEFTRHLLAEKKWLNEEILVELEALGSVEEVLVWWKGVRALSVEGLLHGNLYKEDALNMTDLITRILKPQPLPTSQWFTRRCVLLPAGSELIYERDLRDPNNVNNAVEYMLHLGTIEDRQMKARLLLWAQMSQERAFDTLRTKEQLGYVVFSGSLMQATTMGYRVLVQSERPCAYLEERIEAFLNLDWEMDDEAFEKHKQSVLNRLQESLKNLNQESNRLWWHVASEAYDFLQVDEDSRIVGTLSKGDMREFYERYVRPGSPTRAKLSVHLKSVAKRASGASDTGSTTASGGGEEKEGREKEGGSVYITDVSAWKAGMVLSRGPRPVRPLEEMERTSVKL